MIVRPRLILLSLLFTAFTPLASSAADSRAPIA